MLRTHPIRFFALAALATSALDALGVVQPVVEQAEVNGYGTSLLIVGSIADPGHSMDPEVLAAYPDHLFTATAQVPTYGFSPDVHWIRIRVFNFESRASEKILEVANPILNRCNLYEVTNRGIKLRYQGGDDVPHSTRPVSHLNYLFPVWLEANSTREYLLEISAGGEQLQAPLYLWNPDELIARDEQDRLLRGIYFGIILFVLLFNLFIYLFIREKSSLWYVVYVFMLLMLQLSLGGFGFQYFWPNSPYMANVANPFFASFSILALIRFTQLFLSLKEHYPKLNKVFGAIAILVSVNVVLSLIYTPFTFRFSVISINSLALLLNIFILPTVVLVMRKGFKPARFFLFAFVALVVSVFFFILTNFGVIHSPFYSSYGLQIGSALEVILLSFAIVDRFRRFREDAFARLVTINEMKARANAELEQKVIERTEEIVQQKLVVEQQKDELIDSIRYAERIQKSLIPDEDGLGGAFRENFVYFRPRDIVSGDFYWFGRTGRTNAWHGRTGIRLFAAVDCTGHGVPGALMSVLGYNALDRAMDQPEINSPAGMLNFLNNEIIKSLRDRDSNVNDGMDIALCAYHPDTGVLEFAGAKNNVYILRAGMYIELKGDRFAIGQDWIDQVNGYTNHTFQMLPGDTLYTFTDGFPDQFGGSHNKKLKSKSLLSILEELAGYSLQEQKVLLSRVFEMWKGHEEQTDDVCLIAVRV